MEVTDNGDGTYTFENGYVNGTSAASFSPESTISRQQMAVLLFRFAQANGYDNGGRAALTGFPDAGSVSDYAAETLQWAVAGGIIGGTSQGTLNPQGTATRAQFAAMLYRLLG